MTFSSVGYGDFSPMTDWGKALSLVHVQVATAAFNMLNDVLDSGTVSGSSSMDELFNDWYDGCLPWDMFESMGAADMRKTYATDKKEPPEEISETDMDRVKKKDLLAQMFPNNYEVPAKVSDNLRWEVPENLKWLVRRYYRRFAKHQ